MRPVFVVIRGTAKYGEHQVYKANGGIKRHSWRLGRNDNQDFSNVSAVELPGFFESTLPDRGGVNITQIESNYIMMTLARDIKTEELSPFLQMVDDKAHKAN
jgi:hypothetical protein